MHFLDMHICIPIEFPLNCAPKGQVDYYGMVWNIIETPKAASMNWYVIDLGIGLVPNWCQIIT